MVSINIEKRHLFLFSAIVVFVVGVGLVIGYTASMSVAPDPGHGVSSVGGYFSGDDSLDDSLAKFCQDDGTNCGDFLHAEDGYQELASGLILQWGTAYSDSDSDEIFTFPTPFSVNAYSVQLTLTKSGSKITMPVKFISSTDFTVNRDNDMGDQDFRWFAVGK